LVEIRVNSPKFIGYLLVIESQIIGSALLLEDAHPPSSRMEASGDRLWQENVKVVQLADEGLGAGPAKVKKMWGSNAVLTSLSHN